MSGENIGLKIKIGALLTVIYAVLAGISSQLVIIPGVTGYRLMDALPIVYGLLFGSTGAFACGVGVLFADAFANNLSYVSFVAFLGAYGAAYIPFRVWQGMKSEREPVIILESTRTLTMFIVLAVLAAIPQAMVIPLLTDRMGIAPYTSVYYVILLNSLFFSVVGGTLLYKFFSLRFLEGTSHQLWLMVRDTKTTTKILATSLLRITLTGAFVGVAFTVLLPQEFGQNIIIYVMGIISLVLLILTRI
ncbi:MAG: hypothetical protein LKJ99_01685 [Acidaminococcaceae bacterium]|jgi:energy-coupling factor transport system substrate-specific component|nr:hypothetical protein [Acidaminococcaceae bacterium]MCI2109669.1 hypothetical protein [Acidaminococcaceae bacterium]